MYDTMRPLSDFSTLAANSAVVRNISLYDCVYSTKQTFQMIIWLHVFLNMAFHLFTL